MSSEHTTKNYTIFEIAMNLAATCFISGVIIAVTYFITSPIAAEKAVVMKNDSMKVLVKEAETFKPVDGKKEWYAAQKGSKTIAYVVPAESKGFGGAIKILVAVSPEGKVIDYDIIEHKETPGLGDNANKEAFKKQLRGKSSEDLEVVKDPSNTKNVQAMTGATISSRAVVKGIKEAALEVKHFAGGK